MVRVLDITPADVLTARWDIRITSRLAKNI